jgi:two-component system, OmpR family, phosphate regulon sensor histidine kinase PhoR
MKKTLLKILIGMIVLLFFPVGIVVFYEYTKANDNEELINTVYKNQLESIVSSINSYSQDIVGIWASRLELSLKYHSDSSIFNRLVNENPAITGIYLAYTDNKVVTVYLSPESVNASDSIVVLLKTQSKTINQLETYFKSNYRKFQSHSLNENNRLLYFISESGNSHPVVCFINIDLLKFLQNHISPRIQSIAQDNFQIDLIQQPSGKVWLSTEKNLVAQIKYDQEGEMWLFPQIKIGISLKNQTITDLAAKRVNEGLLLIGVLFIVLLVGIWFLYVSVKREIQLAQIKSEFISNVSHEIRTPLALISMYIETLELGRVKSDEKVHEYYGIIGKETQRLTGIVNKILNFSKMESGKRPFKYEVNDLNSITQKVLETYEFHLNNKGFTLNFSPATTLPKSLCDSMSVADAIINLIDNAIKYSREIKKIEISTGTENNFCWVEVKDFGMGISRKHQKMVFDKFFRVTNENLANEVKGTGLGLSIVTEIVKAHKGRITLESKPGEGSIFRLFFPIIQETIKS